MAVYDQIMEIFLSSALYFYDFDLESGIVNMDIVDRNGINYTERLGLRAPCSFDELMKRSFSEEYLSIGHVVESEVEAINQANLLMAFHEGRRLVNATFYVPEQDKYNRISYFLLSDEETGKPHAYVSCVDITAEEKSREVTYDELRTEKSEIEEIVACAQMGIWRIELFENQAPRLRATPKFFELAGIDPTGKTEEELYDAWYSRIKRSSIPSVNASVNEMIEKGFSENTYTWIHPTKGEVFVRCGGTSRKEAGGYVLRGYHGDVSDIVNAENRQKQLLADALEEVRKQKQLLQEALDNYKEADYDRRRDFLTGLRNRQDMFEFLQDALSGKREKINAMFMMDIDSFKLLNDHYGHTVGDECLQKIGAALNKYATENDIYFYRYGGEEILGISFETGKKAAGIAQELLELVRSLNIERDDLPEGKVTVSLGYTTDNKRYEKMIDRADAAMYKAKADGKNRIVCFEEM